MRKLIISSVLLLQACSATGFQTRCYEVVGDPDGTRLILEENPSQPKLTVTDPVGGEDVEGFGTLEDGVFVFPDGTRLNYNDEKAWYTNSDFVAGIEATAVTCE